jgi:Ca2+-binding RTX toxin-like protein
MEPFYNPAMTTPQAEDIAGIRSIYGTTGAVAGSVSINDVTITEGNAGTQIATFTVSRTGGTAAFAVNFATVNNSALSGSDYVATAGTLSFGSGVNTQTVSVTINGDTTVEPTETFFVNLSAATGGATISDSQGVGAITNDDAGATNDPNFLIGTPGPDLLNGGVPGNQTMDGRAGDDTFIVGGPGDVVIEDAGPGSGIDTIASLASEYTLPENVETMVLAGSGNIGGTGNALNNLMIGNDGANTLNGADGNDALAGAGGNDSLIGGLGDDFLNGGPGTDTMDGGLGNDFYIVDSSSDVILPEGTGPGSGTESWRAPSASSLEPASRSW